MRKKILPLLLGAAALLVSITAYANDIEPSKEFYFVPRAANPMVLDGALTEWSGVPVLADPKFYIRTGFEGTAQGKGSGGVGDVQLVLFERYNGGDWTGPDDHTSAVQIVYDAENVYFGFVVTDEYHENAANSAWNGDSVQLMIANSNRTAQVALYNYALGGIETALGTTIIHHEAGAPGQPPPGVTEAVVTRNTNTHRTTYEIKLPKAAVGLTTLPGAVFGLGMAINDGDQATPGQKGWGGLGAHSIVFGKTPSETALITLTRGNDIEPSKEFYTAVPAPNPIVLDGNLDEWTGAPVLADPKFYIRTGLEGTAAGKGSAGIGDVQLVLFERYNGGDWTGPDDHTSAVQVVYDANNVYFGFVVTDEYHENAANSAWNGDSVQLMVANSNRTAQVALYNYALGGVEGSLGSTIIHHEAGAPGQPPPGVTEAVVTRNMDTHRTVYEIKLPVMALGLMAPLTNGVRFGLGMAINDGDQATPGQKGWGGLGAHSIVFGKTPSETALVTLGTAATGGDLIFLSAINPGIDSFSFRANDKGTSLVDPATARITIDGQTFTPVASPRMLDAIDFVYTPPVPFPANADHSYMISVRDTLGNVVTDQGTFRTPPYVFLTAADKVTSPQDPGFIWRVHQNGQLIENSISRALRQLAGLLGHNFADPLARGPTFVDGEPGPTPDHPITFQIEEVLNLDSLGSPNGEITGDSTMPGIPGLGASGQTDGIAAEITTFIDLPAGRHTLVVNSDDGFRTTAGNINDIFRAQLGGQFDQPGGRPPTDTVYDIRVQEAGVYAFRTIYQQGQVGASIEWKYQKPDGSRVLLNDVANGSFSTYRRATGLPTGIDLVSPLPGATGVALDTAIFASITEGATTVDLNSVRLGLDGSLVTATPTRVGNVITISYQPPDFLTPTQHTASITYTAGGTPRTETWTFTIEPYATLTPAHKAVSVNNTELGFVWRVFQNEDYTHTTLAETELALAGQLIAPGQTVPLVNRADPNAVGVASGAGVQDGPLLRFDIPTVINLSQIGGTVFGNFPNDDQMPGIPGTTGADNGIDAEIITFVEFPAGVTTMGVNSDDGFRMQAGFINRPQDGVILGQFDGGRGAGDTIFKVVVQEAGIYPLRTIWQEGGGDANIELFTVNAEGTKVLLNDFLNNGLLAYRVGVAPDKGLSALSIQRTGVQIQILWNEPGAILEESNNLKDWTSLPAATSPHTATPGTKPILFYRLKK